MLHLHSKTKRLAYAVVSPHNRLLFCTSSVTQTKLSPLWFDYALQASNSNPVVAATPKTAAATSVADSIQWKFDILRDAT